MKIQSLEDLQEIAEPYRKSLYAPDRIKVNIGMASCGIAAQAKAAYQKAVDRYPGDNGVTICQTGCIGFCEEEPLVEILAAGKPRLVYRHITENKIIDAIEGYRAGEYKKNWLLGQMQDPRSVLEDDIGNPLADLQPIAGIPVLEGIPFYKNQVKIAMRNCGYIDPDCIEEYFARKGYAAFLSALQDMKPS
jgi:NADH-quinone oxidoreductase subunit F